jgi:hypothetical protein
LRRKAENANGKSNAVAMFRPAYELIEDDEERLGRD